MHTCAHGKVSQRDLVETFVVGEKCIGVARISEMINKGWGAMLKSRGRFTKRPNVARFRKEIFLIEHVIPN